MGKNKDKHKSRKTKDGETQKSGKEKKSIKEKTKAAEKKSARPNPKSNKSKVVYSKSPKSKDKSNKTKLPNSKVNSYKAAVAKKTVPKKVKKVHDIKEAIKKACKVYVKSPKKKLPLKTNKEKKPAPPLSTAKKAIVKCSALGSSESSQGSVPGKEASKAPEETGELDKSTSVDLSAESVEEKSSGQQREQEVTTDEEQQPDEAEAEKEQASLKSPAESAEFTKPTVNQPKGRKEASPMCYSAEIADNEFEALYDEITDLNSGATTLKHSYGSIVTSLVHMHNRRVPKNKMGKQQQPKQFNFMNTRSEVSPSQAEKMEECFEGVEKYEMERFINPVTREKTFKMLFDEIEDLNKKTHKLRTEFFDNEANFLREKYDNQKAFKIERKSFNQLKLWTKKLLTVVDEISRTYNNDLLNMLRLDGV